MTSVRDITEERSFLPYKVKLDRGKTGKYSWEIQVSDDNLNDLVQKLNVLDSCLIRRYVDKKRSDKDAKEEDEE